MELKKVIAVRTAKTVYRDGDKAIKVFGDEYKKSDILNEALNQARVEETGIPMPKLIEVCKLDGKWAIVSDYIEGKTTSAAYGRKILLRQRNILTSLLIFK